MGSPPEMKLWAVEVLVLCGLAAVRATNTTQRAGKSFSLFSIVQFPNQQCTSSSSSSTYGTCFTSSECSAKGGSADGNCAAGFGVCCVIYTSTCGATVTTNTTYIRNPSYPSSYTPSSTGSCTHTIDKVSDDVCQLRLDFQTMSGFATSTTAGLCSDSFAAAGQTGVDPPSICGTNTNYHMYVEFGATSTDTVKLTITYGSTTTAKTWNILSRQISCTATWKAPTDCTQYFTGASGTVKSYNYAGGQLLNKMYYTNCIRTEAGYCRIQWKESSTSSPDTFDMTPAPATTALANGGYSPPAIAYACPVGYIYIPDLSMDGRTGFTSASMSTAPPQAHQSFYSTMCGTNFGLEGGTTSLVLVSAKQPFVLGVYTDTTTALTSPTTGFNMDYTQLAC